ncbi:transcription antitermination factor NusB [Vallitalea pronyensis]|uniref:Transcription antitermination protein NusB n=1 Tax=Vallitalea pronyensis TaxID=1348613 RepID=A0A8J8SHU9_9FIRM|nr:transcription antitermination factor NusB [Vallitalea pronyensis]QUI23804.1 transcription antitermination factor NusB [Vallitalea pronyensis]
MNRRTMREHIFKAIFSIEFNDEAFEERMEVYLGHLEADEDAKTYIRHKGLNISNKLSDIDQVISQHATKWSIDRMAKVDVSILRLAVYEIRYDEDIPTNVAINEAVEIAKKYGGDHSASFVNGILAKVVN